MAQQGRGKTPVTPTSFFEIDDLDTNWDGEEAPDRAAMKEPSRSPPEPSSEVCISGASRPPPGGTATLDPGSPLAGLELDLVLEEDDAESGLFPKRAPAASVPIEDAAPPLHDIASERPPGATSRSAETVPLKRGVAAAPARASEPAEFELDLGQLAQARNDAELDEGARPTSPDDPILTEARDRYATGDYSGALVVAEGVLQFDPQNELAQRYAQNCRQVLQEMYLARIGPLTQVPRVTVEDDRLRWLSLDHRAGFLLSLIDGCSTLEELLDISGMPRFDALRIFDELLDQSVIALPEGR